jgi:tetratricopeptide (TPR) repeat protein
MTSIIRLLFAIILIFFGLQSCSKKMIIGMTNIKDKSLYDSTAFDYVYVEALRQKFLGNEGEALKYLEQCIRINPNSAAAYYEMGQIAFQLGDIANAKKFALQSVDLNERNVWYLTFLASIFYQEKNLDSAIIYCEKAVKYFPEKESLKITLGSFYTEKGEYKKANEIYNYIENRYGKSESTNIMIVKGLINSGELKTAEERTLSLLKTEPDKIIYNSLLAEVYRAEGATGKALEVYKKLMANDASNPQTLLSFADFLITEKDYTELIKLLNIIVINNDISREDKITLLTKLLENNELIKTNGDGFEMVLLVMESIYKNDDIVCLVRPELYQKEGKEPEAIGRLEELIKINPDNYYAWEKLLLLYSDKGDYDNLFEKGRECATKFNMSFLAKILYANAALEKGELKIAEEELKKSKILAGDKTDMLVQVLTMEADLFYRKKEFIKSYETFKEAIKLSPENMVILNNYAYYLAEQGEELKEAERMARKVIEKEKDNYTYLDTYAWVLYKRGRISEAARIMESIIKKGKKEDAEWCEHYGFMLKAEKKCDEAVRYWQKAQSLDKRKDYLDKEIQDCIK